MSRRRPNARQRSNRRLADDRAAVVALPSGLERRPRVPLTGYEARYEITRDGYVYSCALGRFIQHTFFEGRLYIQLQVDGKTVQLNIQEAADASWAQAPGRLFLVDFPAATIVALGRDEREALVVALEGLIEELRSGRHPHTARLLSADSTVPAEWLDTLPYMPEDLVEKEMERALEDGGDSPQVERTLRQYLVDAAHEK